MENKIRPHRRATTFHKENHRVVVLRGTREVGEGKTSLAEYLARYPGNDTLWSELVDFPGRLRQALRDPNSQPDPIWVEELHQKIMEARTSLPLGTRLRMYLRRIKDSFLP